MSAAVAVPTRFRCVLEQQPTYMVPRRLLRFDAGSHTLLQLQVNPRCWFARDGTAPEWLRVDDLPPSFDDPDVVWVPDVAATEATPFWLGPAYRSLLADCRPGDTAPRDVSPQARAVLWLAGILVDEGYEARLKAERSEAVALASQRFAGGYAPLTGLIHPYLLGTLRTYYRRLVRNGAFTLGDERVSRRFAAHNEPIAVFFHRQLAGHVGACVGEPVKPSYVYFSAYQSGAELTKHVDRTQCEFSISFQLDATPEPLRESPWPLCVETSQGTVTVFQCLGDGLLYKGRELPHFRQRLPHGCTSTSIFFHYVRDDFDGPLR